MYRNLAQNYLTAYRQEAIDAIKEEREMEGYYSIKDIALSMPCKSFTGKDENDNLYFSVTFKYGVIDSVSVQLNGSTKHTYIAAELECDTNTKHAILDDELVAIKVPTGKGGLRTEYVSKEVAKMYT